MREEAGCYMFSQPARLCGLAGERALIRCINMHVVQCAMPACMFCMVVQRAFMQMHINDASV